MNQIEEALSLLQRAREEEAAPPISSSNPNLVNEIRSDQKDRARQFRMEALVLALAHAHDLVGLEQRRVAWQRAAEYLADELAVIAHVAKPMTLVPWYRLRRIRKWARAAIGSGLAATVEIEYPPAGPCTCQPHEDYSPGCPQHPYPPTWIKENA